ncbi:ribosomal maturation YjgA family protein [Janthinobacterium sp. B9-8]|uniref:ribosomal maturation YjgA family protein n=1 Tax=Janthinobacterium sp. B9-8 TaxID=1236179 RepID=UPI00061CE138|nr:DUF2809 domain-containing protein [Janthinobacterium sp. B9-8]AMC34619.1 hypothetical protein VN23_08380 [Janthinobacterium sp. B9-8]
MPARSLYYFIALIIFLIEITIARGLFGNGFIRGSVGDILVIALIYSLFRANHIPPLRSSLFSITAGFVVEGLQYIHLVDLLGLQKGSVLYIVIGNTFSPHDLLMYIMGGTLAWGLDQTILRIKSPMQSR